MENVSFELVDETFDSKAADRMGLSPGKVVVQIHCGSRGFGHQVCSDYVKEIKEFSKQKNLVN